MGSRMVLLWWVLSVLCGFVRAHVRVLRPVHGTHMVCSKFLQIRGFEKCPIAHVHKLSTWEQRGSHNPLMTCTGTSQKQKDLKEIN